MEHRDEVEALSEKVRTLEARLDEERRIASAYRALFHAAPDAMVVTDDQGQILDVNDSFVALLGYGKDELHGRRTDDLSHPDDIPVERSLFGAVARGVRDEIDLEKRYRRKDGTWIWGRLHSGVARDASGKVIAAHGTVKNAEDDLRTLTSVRAVEARNRALLDAVPDLLFIMTADGRFLDCKPARDVALMMPPSAFLGRRITDVLPPELAERQGGKIRDVAETGVSMVDEYSLPTPEGVLHFEALFSRASTGEVVVAVRDVTKRVLMEKERDELGARVVAKANELRRWKALADRAPDAIALVDLDGKVAYANAAFEELLGKSPLEGMSVTRVLARREEAKMLAETMAEHGSYRGEVALLRGDGSQLLGYGVLFIVTNESGEPTGYGALVRDRTEEQRAEEERLLLREKLIDAQQSLIRELEAPLLPVGRGVLVMPIVGRMDAARAERLLGTLLEGITTHAARVVIMDITGVPVVSAEVAEGLVRAATAARLLGAETRLTGVGPGVARELVAHAEEIATLSPCSTLEQAVSLSLGLGRKSSIVRRG